MSAVEKALEAYVRDRRAREKAVRPDNGKEPDTDDIEKASRRFDESERQLLEAIAKSKKEKDAPPELLERAQFSEYYKAARQGKSVAGAEKELVDELKINSEPFEGATVVPWALLEPLWDSRQLAGRKRETAADTHTTLTDGDYSSNLQPAVLPVFARSDAGFLGIQARAVQPGASRVPVVSSVPTPGAVAKNQALDSAAASIAAIEFTPHELRASVTYARRELFNFEGQTFESALRDVFRLAMMDALDEAVIWDGDGTTNEVRSLYNSWTGSGLPSNPSGEADFAEYTSEISGLVDGRYAQSEATIRVLVGDETWKHARTKLAASTAVDALEKIMAMGAMVQSSARTPDIASKRQDALASLSLESAMSYNLSVWEAFGLLRDEFGDSESNTIRMSAFSFYDAQALRGTLTGNNRTVDGFARLRFQVQP